MDACCEESWCKSFDYVKEAFICYLQDANSKEVSLKRNFKYNPYDYWEIKRSEVHVIGSWEQIATRTKNPDYEVEVKVKKIFTSSTTEGSTESNYNKWSRDVTNAHRVSVSHTPQISLGDVSASGPSAEYEYDHTEVDR